MHDHAERLRYYFAYGSNMNPSQMERRCPGAEAVGAVCVQGYRFLINQRGVATLASAPGQKTYGVLWRLTTDHESSLDHYEGLATGRYEKSIIPVHLPNSSEILQAFVYIDPMSEPGSAREGYQEGVLEGALAFRLPPSHIAELRQWLAV